MKHYFLGLIVTLATINTSNTADAVALSVLSGQPVDVVGLCFLFNYMKGIQALARAKNNDVCNTLYPYPEIQCKHKGKIVSCTSNAGLIDTVVTTCHADQECAQIAHAACLARHFSKLQRDDGVYTDRDYECLKSVDNERCYAASCNKDKTHKNKHPWMVCASTQDAPFDMWLHLMHASQTLKQLEAKKTFFIEKQPLCYKRGMSQHKKQPKVCKRHKNYYR